MKTVTLQMEVWARTDPAEAEGFRLLLVPRELRMWMGDQDVCLETVPIEFQSPNMSHEAMVLKAIQTLRDKQEDILAGAQLQVARLDERINRLLMLTHQPMGEAVVLPRKETT